MFASLPSPSPDPLWAQALAYRADPRPGRLDLVVGVYRDEAGATPVMRAVAEAERRLAHRAPSKEYVGLSGCPAFAEAVERLVLAGAGEGRRTTVQTVAGTGALHVLAGLVARTRPGARVLVGTPTYVNHVPVLRAAGLEVAAFPHLDAGPAGRGRASVQAVLDAVAGARPGDVLLLHGCCHNPTGTDLDAEGWVAITEAVLAAGVVPFVDLAYYGLGRGLDEDLAGTRHLAARVPEALIAVSGSKAFGLYNERVGAAIVLSEPGHAGAVRGTLEALARAEYSQPPHHGAAIVTEVLGDPALLADWRTELDAMRSRIDSLRAGFLDALDPRLAGLPQWQALRAHRGMFSTLPLGPEAMSHLSREHAVYGTPGGRVNLAGLTAAQVGRLAEAVNGVVLGTEARRSPGPPLHGAGSPLPDAGSPLPDAGSPPPDAGSPLRGPGSRVQVSPPTEAVPG
ncbi:aromatic amino acid transaminase [Sinomonas halotolerans]|uniref:Aromatic amino acid transaminase n=1 Tax=Sinomonas halotolerans TaxID=1644133 RepID=A0ABU9X1V4_9MICC